MGTFTVLSSVATFLTVVLVVGAALLALALVAATVQWFVQQRPARLARHESVASYYLRGHAFAH